MDDRTTPLAHSGERGGDVELGISLTLIWPLAETGLAVSTAVSAVVQVAALAMLFSNQHVPFFWGKMAIIACEQLRLQRSSSRGMLGGAEIYAGANLRELGKCGIAQAVADGGGEP